MAEPGLLIGDIGGTNARFALVDSDGGYRDELMLNCADFDSPEKAIRSYLERVGALSPAVICLAVAGPVRDEVVNLTNNHWLVQAAGLRRCFSSNRVILLNDFEAIAYSLVELQACSLVRAGLPPVPDISVSNFTVGVIGPGTGLGAAVLTRKQRQLFALVTEAGHVGFAPETALQTAVWEILRDRFGRVSDERLVSGSGLENIYQAITLIQGMSSSPLKAADIFRLRTTNGAAEDAVKLFFEVMGQAAGNFALATGAFDGIYIAGGIVQRYPDLLEKSAFRSGFENKGRHRHIMESIPTLLIRHPQPGLLGAAVAART